MDVQSLEKYLPSPKRPEDKPAAASISWYPLSRSIKLTVTHLVAAFLDGQVALVSTLIGGVLTGVHLSIAGSLQSVGEEVELTSIRQVTTV